jgi:hypothetical protein
MKTITKYMLALGLIAVVAGPGCEKMLEENPTSFMAPENSFKTQVQARSVLDGVYGSLQEKGWGSGIYSFSLLEQLATDITSCFASATVNGLGDYTFTDNNPKIKDYWRFSYDLINRANLFVENVDKGEFSAELQASYKAEALFLRSLAYFNMVRLFGAVPMPLSPPKSLEPSEIQLPRIEPAEIYAQIIADLEFCETNLGVKGEAFAGQPYVYGHATQGAVQGLLAQIYLYRGSIERRDNKGDGKAMFTKSAEYAKKVINSGKYSLVPYYPDIFREQGNSEVIFDIHYKSGAGIHPEAEGSQMGLYLGISGNVAAGGTYSFPLTAYYATQYYKDADTIRKNWSVVHGKLAQKTDGTWFINVTTTSTQRGWGPGKWRQFPLRNTYTGTGDYGTNIPIMRLGEMHLILAEALNEINNGPTTEAIDAANLLRTRACNVNAGGVHLDIVPRVITAKPTMVPLLKISDYDYTKFKDYLFYERARELSLEWTRYYDLQRWGKLVDAIKMVGTTVNPLTNNKVEPDYFALPNIQAKHYLLPIPSTERSANPSLTQNPGY